MRKSVFRFLVTVATVAAVGFAVAGCSNGSGGLTVTGIPKEFNGMWAVALGEGSEETLWGAESIIDMKTRASVFSKIVRGKVSIPMWEVETEKRWTGNDTLDLQFLIMPIGAFNGNYSTQPEPLIELYFEAVEFKGGKATVKYTD